jgi:hypothetical protein
MKDVIKFREYAEDCRRLAKSMRPEHKATLLEIADAWERVEDERERQGGKEAEGGACVACSGIEDMAARAPGWRSGSSPEAAKRCGTSRRALRATTVPVKRTWWR